MAQKEQMILLQRSLQIPERDTLNLWEHLGEAAQERQMQNNAVNSPTTARGEPAKHLGSSSTRVTVRKSEESRNNRISPGKLNSKG